MSQGPYPAGTRCVITWTAAPQAILQPGHVVTVGMHAPAKFMTKDELWPSGGLYQETDQPHPLGGGVWHPCDWMRPIDDDIDLEDKLIASIYRQAALTAKKPEPVCNPEE